MLPNRIYKGFVHLGPLVTLNPNLIVNLPAVAVEQMHSHALVLGNLNRWDEVTVACYQAGFGDSVFRRQEHYVDTHSDVNPFLLEKWSALSVVPDS